MRRVQAILAVFASRTMLAVLLLGFSSGLPFLLIGKTLQARLTESGIDLATVGYLSLIGLPYALKVLWAPFIDRFRPPPGRRRGWLLLTQAALVAGLVLMAWQSPADGMRLLIINAVLVAVASATQDVAVDAWRIEVLAERELGAGAAVAILGYRLALLVGGGFALVLVPHLGWSGVYLAMAGVQAVGIVATLLAPEPPPVQAPRTLGEAVWRPLADLVQRFGAVRLAAVVGFILSYRLGEFLAFNMATPFLLKSGFSNEIVGWVQGVVGLIATIVGTLLGGALLVRTGPVRGLLVFGVLQAASNLAYWWLAVQGGGLTTLVVVVVVENLCYGMATAAFVAWMMTLCSARFSATQYALLTAVMALGRDVLAAPAGWLAGALGWPGFFLLAIAAALPGLALLPLATRTRPCTGSSPTSA